MEAYVIAVIKNDSGVVKGYRILDIESNSCKDVTKDQLVSILKMNKDFKLENVKLSGGKLQGIYASITELPIIGCDNKMRLCISEQVASRCIVLKIIINEDTNKLHGILVANALGKTKMYKESSIPELLRNKVAFISKTDRGTNIYAKRDKTKITVPKKVQQVVGSSYKVTDAEALNYLEVWDFFKFRQYMMERGYKFDLYTHREEKLDYTVERDEIIKQELLDFSNETRFYIRNIDKRCKIIHLPSGVMVVDDLLETEDTNIIEKDTIIFPNTVTDIQSRFSKSRVDFWLRVKRFLFQTNDLNDSFKQELDFSGVNFIEVTDEWSLPIKPSRENSYVKLYINNIYNNCKLCGKYINNSNSSMYMKSSFKDSQIDCDFTLKGICVMQHSFTNTSLNGKLSLGDDIASMANCFTNSENAGIRFFDEIDIKSESITTIDSCFRFYKTNGKLTELDFSLCNKIRKIENSFKSIGSKITLHNLKDCKSLVSISNSFINSGVTEIYLNPMVKEFSYIEGINYTFDENYDRTLRSGMYSTYDSYNSKAIDMLNIDKRFTRIANNGLRSSYIRAINPDNNIAVLESEAFAFSKLTHFDSGWFNNIKYIPFKCFKSSDLETVIIRENIEELRESCFESCDNISKIVVHPNAKIVYKNLLKKSNGVNKLITAYCVKGSAFEKEAKLRKYMTVLSFATFEEALTAFKGIESSEKQIQRFKFISSLNNTDEELTKEPYIRYAPEIHKIKSLFAEDFSEYVDYIPLKSFNQNGPSIYEYDIFEKLRTLFKNIELVKTGTNMKFSEDAFNLNKVPKRFKYLTLLINMVASNKVNDIFCAENMDMIKKTAHTASVDIIFLDAKCGIFILGTRLIDTYMNYYVIVRNGIVVWMAPFKIDGITNMTIKHFNNLLLPVKSFDESTKINGLTSYLRVGDHIRCRYNYGTGEKAIMFGGMMMPPNNDYIEMVTDILKHNLIIIGSGYKIGITDRYSRRLDLYTDTFLMLDMNSQNIIVAQCNTTDKEFLRAGSDNSVIGARTSLVGMDVLKIMTIQEATKDKTFVEYMRNISNYFSNPEILNEFYIEALTDSKRRAIRSKAGAYDLVAGLKKDEITTSLVDMMDVNTKFTSDEQLNDVLVRAIMNSELVCKLDMTYKQALKMLNIFDDEDNYTFELIGGFGSKLEVYDYKFSILGGNEYWKVYIYHNKNKKEIFISTLPLYDVVNKLARLKQPIQTVELHGLVSLDKIIKGYYTNMIDYETFSKGTIPRAYDGNYTGVKLVVQRQTLETFLMLDLRGYRPIFRFKTLADGMRFLNKNINTRWNSLRRFLIDIYEVWSENVDYFDEYNDYYLLRKEIINGLANNEPINSKLHNIAGLLAKQPEIKS